MEFRRYCSNSTSSIPSLEEEQELSAPDEQLVFEEDFDTPVPVKSNRLFLLILSSFLIILIIGLGISIAFPELVSL
jgi:hypothetical protein